MADIDYPAHLEQHSRGLIELVATDLAAPIPSCPGWAMRDLAAHVGRVWTMATQLIEAHASEFVPPGPAAEAPGDDELVSWLEQRRTALLAAVGHVAPDEPVWGWWGQHDGAFHRRRMTLETAVHHWDAAEALGNSVVLDRALAVDGIDELLDVALPHYVGRAEHGAPSGSLHLHCTDGPGEWLAELIDGQLVVRHEHAKGAAAVRGPASSLLLYLWGRRAPEVEVLGDSETAAAWVALAP